MPPPFRRDRRRRLCTWSSRSLDPPRLTALILDYGITVYLYQRSRPLCDSPHPGRGERLAAMGNAVATLVLLRHGESEWNASNQFTGWGDVALTDKGRGEAVRSGELIAEHNLLPDVLYTSLLRRAITSAHLALDTADRLWIPVRRSWRLNERHYG